MEEAIQFIVDFYSYQGLTREDVIQYYWDEVEAYMKLKMMYEDYEKNK